MSKRPWLSPPCPSSKSAPVDDAPVVVLHEVFVCLHALQSNIELIDMSHPGVLRPILALKLLEGVVEPAGLEEDSDLGDEVAQAGHELRGLPD